jgi:hypothetical protein
MPFRMPFRINWRYLKYECRRNNRALSVRNSICQSQFVFLGANARPAGARMPVNEPRARPPDTAHLCRPLRAQPHFYSHLLCRSVRQLSTQYMGDSRKMGCRENNCTE